MPHYWIVDPESRTIEAYALGEREGEREYELAARALGDTPALLPPFPDLALVPESLWP